MNLGFWEIAAIAGIALLFFGPSRLPGLGKSLGESIRGFKKGLETDLDEERKQPSRPSEQITEAADDGMTSRTKETTGNRSDS